MNRSPIRPSGFAIAVVSVLCTAMTSATSATDLVAHRGASYDAPENTLAAFQLAWEQGADAIEADFHLTADGRIICIHDATTDRTTGASLTVADTTLDELRELDAGSWKDPDWACEKLPTIDEVLAIVPPGKRIFIEIKCGPEIMPELQRAIDSSGLLPEQIVIISFNDDVIAAARQAMPRIKANWLFGFSKKDGQWNATHEEVMQRLLATGATGLDVGSKPATGERINHELACLLRHSGFEFHIYTINDPKLARKALDLGVDSITTDRPGFLRQELAKPACEDAIDCDR